MCYTQGIVMDSEIDKLIAVFNRQLLDISRVIRIENSKVDFRKVKLQELMLDLENHSLTLSNDLYTLREKIKEILKNCKE